jgi:hypothetical protein
MLKSALRRALAFVLCAGLLLPLFPRQVEAQTLTLDIGQPNVWSLAQAHYLLSNMRHENRGLHATTPTGDQLNPNSINGTRLDILRTFLGISAEFSAPAGAQNRAALQGFQQSMARRQEAQTRVGTLSQEHLAAVREISELNFQLAQLPPPPSANQTEDPQITRTRKELTDKVAARTPVRDALAAEISSLNTTLNAAPPTLGSLNSTAPTVNAPTFNDDLKTLMDKLVGGSSLPQVDASTALENYIQMQYEIIAKQLTLLRDEVGPDERLIFLELPSSLYSVPKKDDNFVVQTKWNVHSYFGTCSDIDTAEDEEFYRDNGGAGLLNNQGVGGSDYRERGQPRPITIDAVNAFTELRSYITRENLNLVRAYRVYTKSQGLRDEKEREDYLSRANKERPGLAASIDELQEMDAPKRNIIQRLAELGLDDLPTTFRTMVWRPVSDSAVARAGGQDPCGSRVSRSKFRIVDIIPRQSALNINDTHATQKGFALTAKFLAIFGFGASVGYQRQRSIYEQFIHQDVFASGFGKGLDSFGWTIGPVPGTKRLAPGPRTTYAILAIPRGALAVRLEADAIAFRNNRSPEGGSVKPLATQKQFTILVPQRDTEGFWVDSAAYTPVASGQRVTVLLRGKYFSPLTGVTVDGMPLKRAVAIAKHESDKTTNDQDTTAPGEFEYLNPNELVLNFKVAQPNYVGTPLITLITPEKTAAINYFTDLLINFRFKTSLLRHSKVEPMFIGPFRLGGLRVTSPAGAGVVTAELAGGGFRRRAQILVNGVEVDDPQFESTSLYKLTFPAPADSSKWTITYRLGHEQESVTYVPDVDGLATVAPSIEGIENPSTGKPEGLPAGGEQVIIRGRNLNHVRSVYFGGAGASIDASSRHPNVLFVTVPKGKEGGVRVLLEGITPGGQRVTNVLDFQTPGKAIFKYVPKPKPNAQ